MKKEITIEVEAMSYDNDELTLETKDTIYYLKDKRAICILAERLIVMKNNIQSK